MTRLILILVWLLFLGALLFAPLAVVFASAFENGLGAWFESFTDSDTGAAILLTRLTAAIVVPLNTLLGVGAAWCSTKFEFPAQNLLMPPIALPRAGSPGSSGW